MRIKPSMLKGYRNIVLSKFKKSFKPFRVLHFTTFRCNLRCKYCGIWKTKLKELDTYDTIKIMNHFRKMGVIFWTFTGGEPLVREDIGVLVETAVKLFPLVSLTTNGTLLKERFHEIEKIDYLTVSLDGPEEINDKIRGKGTFKKVIEGIKIARKAKKKVIINTVLSKENLKNNLWGLKEIIKIAMKLGCKFNFNVMYSDQFNKGYISDGSGSPLSEIFPSKKEFDEAIKFIIGLKKKFGDFIQPSFKTIEHMSDENHKWKLCYAGISFIDLFPDGRVLPCIFKEKYSVRFKEGAKIKFPKFYNCRCVSECYSELNNFIKFEPFTWINSFFKGLRK